MTIIDKVKQLHSIISKATEEENEYIAIRSPLDTQIIKKYLNAGKWSSLHLKAHPKTIGTTEIQIIPWYKSSRWPVTSTMPYMETAVISPTVKDYILKFNVGMVNEYRSHCIDFKKDWKTVNAITLPMYELFGGEDNLQYLKELVFDEKNWPESDNISDSELFERTYKSALHFDNSESHRFLLYLVKEYQDGTFLPELPTFELGIHEPRILSSMAIRAYARGFNEPFDKLEPLLMKSVSYAHGFGTETDDLRIAATWMETCLRVLDPIEFLFEPFNIEKISNDTKLLPEFHIAQTMNKQKRGYNGIAHVEVAALMDDQLNNPKQAWKYLQAASYWVGKNMPEAQGTVLDAAMHLCDKHGWKEALEVLEYNKAIMES